MSEDLDFVPSKVDVEVRRNVVYLGGGLNAVYWMVMEDGKPIGSFRDFMDAKNYADVRRREWESNDE